MWGLGGGAAAPEDLKSGWRAFTTMLMFGLNSDSYCTHKAATAASCGLPSHKQILASSNVQMNMKFLGFIPLQLL